MIDDVISDILFNTEVIDEYTDNEISLAYKEVFDNKAGRMVLVDLIKFTNFNTLYMNNDSNIMYFNNGQSSVIERIRSEFLTDPMMDQTTEDEGEYTI